MAPFPYSYAFVNTASKYRLPALKTINCNAIPLIRLQTIGLPYFGNSCLDRLNLSSQIVLRRPINIDGIRIWSNRKSRPGFLLERNLPIAFEYPFSLLCKATYYYECKTWTTIPSINTSTFGVTSQNSLATLSANWHELQYFHKFRDDSRDRPCSNG